MHASADYQAENVAGFKTSRWSRLGDPCIDLSRSSASELVVPNDTVMALLAKSQDVMVHDIVVKYSLQIQNISSAFR